MTRATLFGKLPAHGDFVTRGLTAGERDALDRWLAGSLADAAEALGDDFAATYDLAPPWRFARRSGDGWQAGAMAPSMDGVGRRYPIVVALDGLDEDRAASAAETIEALLYTALGAGWDADRLADAVAAVEPGADAPAIRGDRWWTLGGGTNLGWVFLENSLTGAQPPRLMRAVLTSSEIGREDMA